MADRKENGSWDRVGAHRVSTSSAGFRDLMEWLGAFGVEPGQLRIGCEPSGGWCAETLVAIIEKRTRFRLQLTQIEDILFPELKDFFKHSITGANVARGLRRRLDQWQPQKPLEGRPPATPH